ncbi:hypothetical protein ACHHYP_00446 [Achlya hypogyna]|uniref:Uncharacterized protein n=1 Tax=Achlya hypogyna TaxID=1202772 RepID=A0A1V9ZAR5_ACHHY|nr:hypothetical protein ACHHYP_00446 [Achlya hypogyna]
MVECEDAFVAYDGIDEDGYSSASDDSSCSDGRRRKEGVSGLPWTCSNCGVSFFALRSVVPDDCYCSGECKWSVILFREMDARMGSIPKASGDDAVVMIHV